jgi:hypothetical protein
MFIANICKYLIQNKNGKFENNFEFWLSLFEFGPTSTALFMMWAALEGRGLLLTFIYFIL